MFCFLKGVTIAHFWKHVVFYEGRHYREFWDLLFVFWRVPLSWFFGDHVVFYEGRQYRESFYSCFVLWRASLSRIFGTIFGLMKGAITANFLMHMWVYEGRNCREFWNYFWFYGGRHYREEAVHRKLRYGFDPISQFLLNSFTSKVSTWWAHPIGESLMLTERARVQQTHHMITSNGGSLRNK